MNYKRIYAEFIKDRRDKQESILDYCEKHHVTPRSLGGSDEKENIVRLVARDHYFAHCCLAKIHGGKMWSALFAIANMTKTNGTSSYFLRGRMVSVSRKRAAEVRSVNMTELWASGAFKRNRIYAPHSDETKAKIAAAGVGRKPTIESVEKQRKTTRASAVEFSFVCISTGDVFKGTQQEFSDLTGISQSLASYLTRGKIRTAKGWMLLGTDSKTILGRDPAVRVFANASGETFAGTTYEFRTKYSLDSGGISNLINGKNGVQSFKGWRYSGTL
jgi:hypothetical protein